MDNQSLSNLPGKARTVFVAEVDPVYRAHLVEVCRELGLSVTEASHGNHAWKLLQREPPDLLLAGWTLPEISGIGLLNLVRSDPELCALPVVLTTKRIGKEQVLEAGRAGVTDILLLSMTKEEIKHKLLHVCQPVQDVKRSHADAVWKRGVALMKKARYAEALEAFQEILEIYGNAEIYYNMGYIKTAMEQYQEAIYYFRRATEINSACAKAYRMMAECHHKLGQEDKAAECLQRAADIFLEKDLDDEAEEALKQRLALNPKSVAAYSSLGVIYRKRGDLTAAAEQYRKAMEINPGDENLHHNLAGIYYQMGELPQAAETLQRALAINPQFEHARELLEAVQRQLESGEKPEEAAQRID